MLTVVVVDDILALVVIATVYTETLEIWPLLAAVALFGAVLVARRLRFQAGLVCVVLGTAAWVALLESGVEPVVVGLAAACSSRSPLPGRPSNARRTVPRVSRAADRGACPPGQARAQVGDLRERAVAAALPSLDELPDRAALRARERRDRDRRRGYRRALRHRSRSGSWSATSSASPWASSAPPGSRLG